MGKLCRVLLEMSESEDPWLMSGASPSELLSVYLHVRALVLMGILEKCESNIYESAVSL